MKKYVIMAKNECGEEFRAYDDIIEVPYMPHFDLGDYMAFANKILDKVIGEIKESYPEAYDFHIERLSSDMSLYEYYETYGYPDVYGNMPWD